MGVAEHRVERVLRSTLGANALPVKFETAAFVTVSLG
jgi:hypothetical protein